MLYEDGLSWQSGGFECQAAFGFVRLSPIARYLELDFSSTDEMWRPTPTGDLARQAILRPHTASLPGTLLPKLAHPLFLHIPCCNTLQLRHTFVQPISESQIQ